jgi:tetratricopeptide (TPR) repeat protein
MRLTARFTFAATLLAVTLLGSASHAALITQRPAAPESTAVTQVRHSAGDANELIRTAVAQRFGGDADGAVRALGKVLEADPDSAEALGYQALAQFDRGDFRSAADSFRQAHHRAASLRAMLGRYLALGRIGENADAELKVVKASLPFEQTTSLDYVVAGYYLGQRSLADLSAAARTIEDVCTVQFYKSELDLMQNRFEIAAEGLKGFADACPKTMMEYPSALADLKRLENDGYLRGVAAGKPSLTLKLVDRR